jgi:uncharacterized damage-inducible protein DinB
MNRFIPAALLIIALPCLAAAQDKPANPVTDAVRAALARSSKIMVAAAEAMPADKYGFKPTPEQGSFGHLAAHIAESNFLFCSKIGGSAAPEQAKLSESDGKDKLVAAIKSSFEFCSASLAKADDSNLGENIILFANRSFTRAASLLMLAGSWTDHYSEQAMYLRLNGVLPPTAQPAKKD